jgi:hypothetical protein
MLRSIWRHWKKDWAMTSQRSARASTRRPTLEALEDRLVPAAAFQIGPNLTIVADPGTVITPQTILLQVDSINPSQLDVKEGSTSLGHFSISSIHRVNAQVAGNDVVDVNDSNGFPFAPGTTVALFGRGANNKLSVVGNRAISGFESFLAGSATQNTSLSLAGTTFQLSGAISRVADEVDNASPLILQTAAPSIDLTGTDGVIETLSGLTGTGIGGNVLSFKGIANVELETRGTNETVTLNATAAAQGLHSLSVVTGGNSTTQINATPITSGTSVFKGTFVSDFGGQVNVAANAGTVGINGNSSTTVNLGTSPNNPSKSVTSDINAFVSIQNVGALNIYDGGNTTTKENVTLTPSSITGTGLFGPNGSVQYSSTPLGRLVPQIFAGQLHETYTVSAPNNSSFFASGLFDRIEQDSTTGGLSVTVDVTAFTDLDLVLISKDPAASSLFISAPANTFYNPFRLTSPNGFVEVAPPGALHSTAISYTGFDTVGHS